MTFASGLFKASGFALACAMSLSVAAQNLFIPERAGPRPKTTDRVPHMQIGVTGVPQLSEQLIDRVDAMRGVAVRPTVISIPGAWGILAE